MTTINIIIPPVWSGVYLNTARLLKYTLEDLGKISNIIESGTPMYGDLAIVLGWNLIPEKSTTSVPYIIYQLEPLALPLWQEKLRQKIKFFKNARAVWDYSTANLKYLTNLGLEAMVMPLGYHKRLKEAKMSEFYD